MERVVTAEMLRPALCSLCGQFPPCPHVPTYEKGKVKSGLAHWVGNQVEIQHAMSRCAQPTSGRKPTPSHTLTRADGHSAALTSSMRVPAPPARPHTRDPRAAG